MKELFGPDLKGKKLLELGCSSGMFLSFAQHEGLKVHGLDISKLAVEEAKMATHAEAYPCDLSKENIPFAKDQFDIVVAFDLVEHIRDLAHLFSEVQRVLRPGGFFYFITPNGLQPADRDETHYSLKEQAEWEKLTKKYFELISSKTYNYYPPTPYLWIQKVIHQMNRWSGMKIQQVVVVGRKRGK
jgi:cyclopropane fatty-acyl-phospholipid synthase-like methyltransferase